MKSVNEYVIVMSLFLQPHTPSPPLPLPLPPSEPLLVVLLAAIVPSLAMYDKSDDVYDLTPGNFDSLVLKSEHVWVVEFYAPW